MFRVISITGFVIVFLGIFIHWCSTGFQPVQLRLGASPRRVKTRPRWSCYRILVPFRVLVFLLTLLFIPQKLSLIGVLRKLVFLLALLCFVVLLATGFFPRLVLEKPISGYWLMIHATFSPIFAACMAVLAVMWAHNCRLDKNYWPWLQRIMQRKTTDMSAGEKHELTLKVTFWIIIFLALPLILSPVLSMFPLFGTHWQELLAQLHRYVALLLALVVIVHIYLLILTQAKQMTVE